MLRIFLLTAFTFLQIIVFAQDKAELEKKRKQTLQEIEVLNNQYNEVKKIKSRVLVSLC